MDIFKFLSKFNYKFSIILDKVIPVDLTNLKIDNSSNIYASINPLT